MLLVREILNNTIPEPLELENCSLSRSFNGYIYRNCIRIYIISRTVRIEYLGGFMAHRIFFLRGVTLRKTSVNDKKKQTTKMTKLDWRELWPSKTMLQAAFPKSYLNNLFLKCNSAGLPRNSTVRAPQRKVRIFRATLYLW